VSQCQGPGCTNPVVQSGLCLSHYRQRQRHPARPLKPLRGRQPLIPVSFLCPVELREAVEQDAAARGMTLTEWWVESARLTLRNR
jgi:hypothetical protein